MRRVIQKTVTTTKIISLTITHSESHEEVEYTLADSADELSTSEPPTLNRSDAAIEPEQAQTDGESPAAIADTPADQTG